MCVCVCVVEHHLAPTPGLDLVRSLARVAERVDLGRVHVGVLASVIVRHVKAVVVGAGVVVVAGVCM